MRASSSATARGKRSAISISRRGPADDQRPSCSPRTSPPHGAELRQAAEAAAQIRGLSAAA
jgi:hypothetical protein